MRLQDLSLIHISIVQSRTDEECYLDQSWEGNYSPAGAIFIQTYNAADFTDYNTVIYGHRMGNGNETMFHDVHNYMDMDYLKSHQNITVYTRDHIRSYKVFAAVVYDDRLIPVSFDFSAESGRQAFLDSLYASEEMCIRDRYENLLHETKQETIENIYRWEKGNKELHLSAGTLQKMARAIEQYDTETDYWSVRELANGEFEERCV